MLSLVKNTIKQIVFIPLFIFSSAALSETLNFSDVLTLIDENGIAVIPDNYTAIGSSAFESTNVREIIMSDSIVSIGQSAFRNTLSLKNIQLSQNITVIPEYTFTSTGLTHIDIPESVIQIDYQSFAHSMIETISMPDGIIIGEEAFADSNLMHLVIPRNASVSWGAFRNLNNLVSVEIKSGASAVISDPNLNSSVRGHIFRNSGQSLKTLIYETPPDCFKEYVSAVGSYYGYHNAYGLCFYKDNLDKLEFMITMGNLPSGFNSAPNSTYVLKGDTSGSVSARDVIALHSLSGPISNAQHSYCPPIDSDNDGHQDCYDQFPNDPDRWFDYGDESNNTSQPISNDSDGDGILDTFDADSGQNTCYEEESFVGFILDTDQDGIANREDCDDDNDGLFDVYEPFFGTNPLIPDSDFDGTLDGLDAFPLDNTETLDTDSDGIGNNADTDDDNDGYTDFLDAFPTDATEWADSDLDGIGNNADPDDDNDGVSDDDDAFPYTASESVDTDGDGVGDNSDAFPNDSSETVDTDLDGIGNNADGDDDNDGIVDADDSDPLNDAVGALESQSIFVMGNPIAVNGYLTNIVVGYDVSDANAQLTGIGYRVHYDSSIFSLSEIQNTLAYSNVVDGFGPYQDVENFDNDNTTDSYITFAWASVGGDWPNVELPAQLADINLFVNWANYEVGSTTSNINFSFIDNAQGYEPKATNYEITVLPATWDFDGDGVADALTDGLMMLRYAFGIQTLDMTVDAISTTATLTPVQIVDSMHRAAILADIDGDDSTDALTDGLLLLRYLFGLRGESLINGVVSFDATRTTAEEIEEYIEHYMPPEVLVSGTCSILPDGTCTPTSNITTGITGTGSEEQDFMVGDWRLVAPPQYAYEWQRLEGIESWESWFDATGGEFDCVADDIYKFEQDSSFTYSHGSGTYATESTSIISSSSEDGCQTTKYPWDGSNEMFFAVNSEESTIKVSGKGAYIVLPEVANGINEIPNPYFAPDEVIYNYTKINDNEIQLMIVGAFYVYRFNMERVLS
jgi:hypothetical protein